MRYSAGLALVMVFAASGGVAQAQSFNCRYAHYADEKLICARPELAQLDNELASVFGRAMRRLSPREQNLLDAAEDGWVVERRRCGSDFACIAEQYGRRIEHLSRIAGREGDRFDDEARSRRQVDDASSIPPHPSATTGTGHKAAKTAAPPPPEPQPATASGSSTPTIRWANPPPER